MCVCTAAAPIESSPASTHRTRSVVSLFAYIRELWWCSRGALRESTGFIHFAVIGWNSVQIRMWNVAKGHHPLPKGGKMNVQKRWNLFTTLQSVFERTTAGMMITGWSTSMVDTDKGWTDVDDRSGIGHSDQLPVQVRFICELRLEKGFDFLRIGILHLSTPNQHRQSVSSA